MEEDQGKPAEPLTSLPVKVKHVEPPGGAAEVYANYVDISWTSFDLQYRFSHNQRLPNEPEPTNKIEHRATVTLSWAQAKMKVAQSAAIIEKYEALNGEIKLPPTLP